jgi:tetratricopeptide (TPR) repeat protein
MCIFCYQRTYAWHDAESLLSDAIQKYPYRALLSYKWLGHHYFEIGEYEKAMENYNVLIKLRATDASVEKKVAAISLLQNQGMGAQLPTNGIIQQAPVDEASSKSYLDSSFYYSAAADSLKAFRYFIMALRYNRNAEKIYADSSFKSIQNQQFTSALYQYNVLLKLSTSNPFYYFYRGVAKFSTNRLRDAIPDWEIAVKMDSRDVQQSASYNLSVAYDSIGKDSLAVYYVEMAKAKGYGVSPEFADKLHRKWDANRRKK